jgi:hypothetical protein
MERNAIPDVISTREFMQGPPTADRKGQVLLGLREDSEKIIAAVVQELREKGPQPAYEVILRHGGKKGQYGNLLHSLTYYATVWQDDGMIGLLQ